MIKDAYDRTPSWKFTHLRKKKHHKRQHRKHPYTQRSVGKNTPWRKRYDEVIKSFRWRAFRLKIRKERNNECQRCCVSGEITQLDVHHIKLHPIGRGTSYRRSTSLQRMSHGPAPNQEKAAQLYNHKEFREMQNHLLGGFGH